MAIALGGRYVDASGTGISPLQAAAAQAQQPAAFTPQAQPAAVPAPTPVPAAPVQAASLVMPNAGPAVMMPQATSAAQTSSSAPATYPYGSGYNPSLLGAGGMYGTN